MEKLSDHLGDLALLVTSIGGFLGVIFTGIVTLYNTFRLGHMQRISLENSAKIDEVKAATYDNTSKIKEVHDATNGMKDQLVREVRKASFANGVQAGVKSEVDKQAAGIPPAT